MATEAANECTICKEEFDEDQRCPRILPCSHCICTLCITQLITRNNKKCPFCQRDFNARTAREFGINTVCLDLLKLLRELEAKAAARALDMPREELVKTMKRKDTETNNENIKNLQEEVSLVKQNIKNNVEVKRNILMNQMSLKETIMNKIKDLESRCLVEVEYLEIQNQRLESRLKELEAKITELEDIKQCLDGAKSFSAVDAALDKAETSNSAFLTWMESIKVTLSKEDKILRGIEENFGIISRTIASLMKVLESPVERQVDLGQQREAVSHLDNITAQLTCDMLQNPSRAMKYLANLDGIYAIQEDKGNKRCAKISFSWDQKIFLHCLTQQELPPHVSTIQHQYVMSLIDPSSRTTFLDLGTTDSKLGRILISLTPDSKRAQNFSLLCSGAKGSCYLNTVLLAVVNKGNAREYVIGGDYERNNGTGGKTLVPGTSEENGGVFRRPFSTGSVGGFAMKGDKKAAQFWIKTRDDPSTTVLTAFGQVESGLHVLSDAISKYPNIKAVRIIDCGIVLRFA